jgi:polysaccharide lyase-like protein
MEWHGNSSTLQAPVHFAIDGYTGKYAMDLHTQSGWNPVSFSFGPIIRGRWVDFVIHTKWAKDNSGIVEGWMDGQKMFSSSRQTWYSSGIDSVYPMLGYYRVNYSQSAVFYVDAFKVGTSYQSVAP